MSIIELFAGRSGLELNGAVELTRAQHVLVAVHASPGARAPQLRGWNPVRHRLGRSELFQARGLRSGRVPVRPRHERVPVRPDCRRGSRAGETSFETGSAAE